MFALEIVTIGKLAFRTNMRMTHGFSLDIPIDNLGIPYIPIAGLLEEQGMDLSGIQLGFAHPDGYYGCLKRANDILTNFPNSHQYIRRFYTEDISDLEAGTSIRCIRSGMTFHANIILDKERLGDAILDLAKITKLGVTNEYISGEVKISIIKEERKGFVPEMRDDCKYHRLDYSMMLLTPACIYAPYAEGALTADHIPGAIVSDMMGIEEITCTNAYLSKEKRRMIPVPLCCSVVKLDKTQMRFRLASGKDPDRPEQDVTINGAFTDDFEGHRMEYVTPKIQRVYGNRNRTYDALSAGQVFSGSIYGSDEQIRSAAEHIRQLPLSSMGHMAEGGLGEVCMIVDRLEEDEIRTEKLVRSFDVLCLSDTILINDELMYTCRQEDFLFAIERILGAEGRLEILGRFTDISTDYGLGEDHDVIRCIKRGSVFRIGVKDKTVIDIAKIAHTFIGERCKKGYGEIMCFDSKEGYYRLADHVLPETFSLVYPVSLKEIEMGAELSRYAIIEMLRSKVEGLAKTDMTNDPKAGSGEYVPEYVLRFLKSRYAPLIDDKVLEKWYLDYMEALNDK